MTKITAFKMVDFVSLLRKSPRKNNETALLRTELLSIDQLKRYASNLAKAHKISVRKGPDKLLPRLSDNATVIHDAHQVISIANTGAFKIGQKLTPAENWLLDNYYLIQQQIKLAKRHLPRGYSTQLPQLAEGVSAGYPRIYDLALGLISHMDGRVNADNATQYVSAYQSAEPLMLGELWAFPIMLQLALLENLRRVCTRIANRRDEQISATLWADRMLEAAQNEPKQLIQLLAKFADADVPLTASFVEEFYARLQDQGAAMAFAQTWVEQQLALQNVTATQLLESASRTAAANQISIANTIGSLRFIGTMDWREWVESLSVVEKIFEQDPSCDYANQDFASRDRYRHVLEDIAMLSAKNCKKASTHISAHYEMAASHMAIKLASEAKEVLGEAHRSSHVGYYLLDDGLAQLKQKINCKLPLSAKIKDVFSRNQLFFYAGSILALTIAITTATILVENKFGINIWLLALVGIFSLIASSALAIALINSLVTQVIKPCALPRLDFQKGITEKHRTMVVVPTLINSLQDIDRLLEALEIRYLGNRDKNCLFALLTDFTDANAQTLPQDTNLISHAMTGITALNNTYAQQLPPIFYLFHRPRSWNAIDQIWMGYERKRGKLEQFNALLRDDGLSNINQKTFSHIVGDTSLLSSIKYVITLDTDTQLPRDTAYKLIGNMAHPLNRPIFDAKKGRVTRGYAILQPRASISLISANQTWFSQLYAGESGLDPYTREVSDVYQDIFAEGSFIGKGIYDVDAFRQAVDGRFPNNLILSHDLLESGYARSALVSDVDLIEEHPPSYAMDISRRHRWVRGDWQIAGWLLPRVPAAALSNKRVPNPLSALSVLKIADNLRRSLVPIALFGLLITEWLSGLFWAMVATSLLVLLILYFPPAFNALMHLIKKPKELFWQAHIVMGARSVGLSLILATLTLLFLPYEALKNANAIMQSAGRKFYTNRGLLQWHLPSYTKRNACTSWLDFYKEMWVNPATSIITIVYFSYLQSLQDEPLSVWFFSIPLCFLWSLSPLIAWTISKPRVQKQADLTLNQISFLRINARKTWRYFDDFVTIKDNWLPPDNVQQYPVTEIASRTSPTNIGMGLLANLSAYDFGYISREKLLNLTKNTIDTLEKLPRYRGHFYNWYNTQTLELLHPHYISSVDSGNLAGCFLTLQAGLEELKNTFDLDIDYKKSRLNTMLQGCNDVLSILTEHMPTVPSPHIDHLIKKMQDSILANQTNNLQTPQAVKQIANQLHINVQQLLAQLPIALNLEVELHYWAKALNSQTSTMVEQFSSVSTSSANKEQLILIDQLIERIAVLNEMDFTFLYDNATDLLSIGFDASDRRRDPSCYDLLASEARLASFILIAQSQLPQKHWFSLGRLLSSAGTDVSLLSWSGSMFEYLMPQLLMPSFENTLLDQTYKAVVKRQIKYGSDKRVPWGISESGYNATDSTHNYQYRAFGVPGLGFKRNLSDDLVIAPYASALALMVLPNEACKNLQKLADSGFVGKYGFFEAIDYTPNRIPRGKKHAVVQSFMSHHQGMSLLAFASVLLNKPMQRRFMSTPYNKATELLLQERIPKQGASVQVNVEDARVELDNQAEPIGASMRVFTNHDTPIPEVHLLSNGRYHVMTTNAGGGYSRWHDLAVTRFREDATQDNWGTFVYIRDIDTQRYWSSAYQPTLVKPDYYEAIFTQARTEYKRRDQFIETHTEISVSPEDDIEIRRVTLTNLSTRARNIELTTYAEVVLSTQNADLAHRTFNNLFVQTEILYQLNAIVCTRRPRTKEERVPWMFHLIAIAENDRNDQAQLLTTSFETDRAKFIGRGRSIANPIILDRIEPTLKPVLKSSTNLIEQVSGHLSNQLFGKASTTPASALSNSQGSVLDPIVSIRRVINLAPDQTKSVQIISGMASTREAAIALIEKYCDRNFVERAFEMAWFQSQEVLRMLNATEADAQVYGRLASSLIFCNALRRAPAGVITRNQVGQSGLWRFGVSGDLPIVLIRIGDISRLDLVKQVLQAHTYWRMNGLIADLVIINEDFSGYRADLQDQIVGLINAGPEAQLIDKPGGVFIRRVDDLSEEARVLFQTVARVIFVDTAYVDGAQSLIDQVERRVDKNRLLERESEKFEPTLAAHKQISAPLIKRELIFNNGIGGFTLDGREYIITLSKGQTSPAPWSNVIASPFIGTVVTEGGGAYTWVENAHEFRLSTWHNDVVSDASGEACYIRDEESGVFWSPSPQPASSTNSNSDYICRHGFGYSVFEHNEAGISSEMSTYVAMDSPVKFVVVKLRNISNRPRQLSLTGYWELVMGEWRHANLMHIVTEQDAQTGAILARNAYGKECNNRIVFAHISAKEATLSCSRTEFIGRNGSLASPAAMRRRRLSGRTGAALDPCASLQTQFSLFANEEKEFVFTFGAGKNIDEVHQLINRFGGVAGARQARDDVHEYWNHTLGSVQVQTPDAALNVLANGWLVYQAISCRLWARSGFYQSGGAYGFRDQLQDTLALMHATPWLAREQIIACAQRQFPQGDVQHWWHPPNGQGVRTHFSDDYLWLAYATCRYVISTGDTAILDEQIHFIEGRALNAHEESYYDSPQQSNESASLYEHCVRAIKYGLKFGVHQLPLIGCGDWNDGMNLIGKDGKGESVWLAWFLVDNLNSMSQLANLRGDQAFAEICATQAILLKGNIETHAWDGEWYKRAFFDDGSPLGSKENDECQIDSISQSWAVISKSGDSARAKQAMDSVNQRLIARDTQLIKLLDPPFDKSDLEPGYIKGYVPGVRENGGQYTHAAIWATMAYAMQGNTQRAWELFAMLNPINHAVTPDQAQTYKVEPYVMAADVYGADPHKGRGGWTWYTGAAGWMYQLTLETLLGISLHNNELHISPCVPQHWPNYLVHYRYRDTVYHITINCNLEKLANLAPLIVDDKFLTIEEVHEDIINKNRYIIPLLNDRLDHNVLINLQTVRT